MRVIGLTVWCYPSAGCRILPEAIYTACTQILLATILKPVLPFSCLHCYCLFSSPACCLFYISGCCYPYCPFSGSACQHPFCVTCRLPSYLFSSSACRHSYCLLSSSACCHPHCLFSSSACSPVLPVPSLLSVLQFCLPLSYCLFCLLPVIHICLPPS